MATYFDETVEEFVRRRHAELRPQRKNKEIWPLIEAELGSAGRGAGLSERQLRRIVYG